MSKQSNDPVLEITQSILTEAAQRPWLAALLMRRRPDWLTRLAQLAQRVRNLPRHTRRALRRKLASGLAAAALLLALSGPPQTVYAASITVNGDGTGGTCSLYDAIYAANTDAVYNNCPAGSGTDTITLTVDVSLAAALPDIASDITLQGGGHTITGNDAYRVLQVYSGATLTVTDIIISHGRAMESTGGGIRNYGTAIVQNSTIISNTADNEGGGISSVGTLTVTNSTISGNAAGVGLSGGGGLANFGIATMQNSTVSGNTATGNGGGIYSALGDTTVQNSTISGNTAVNMGGGIGDYSGSVTVQNSIVAQNTGGGFGDCYSNGGTLTSNGYNIESATSCGFTGTGDQQGVSNGNLKLYTLANNGGSTRTHGLAAGSVAIDQIPVANCSLTTDQRGLTRPVDYNGGGAKCDVGAFELQIGGSPPNAVTLRDLTATGNAAPGVIGALGAALAALGALVIGRRRRDKMTR